MESQREGYTSHQLGTHTKNGETYTIWWRDFSRQAVWRPTEEAALNRVMWGAYLEQITVPAYQEGRDTVTVHLCEGKDIDDIRVERLAEVLDRHGRAYGYAPDAPSRRRKTHNAQAIAKDMNWFGVFDWKVTPEQIIRAQALRKKGSS